MANGLGVAALVLGVIAVPLSLLVVGGVLGLVAIVLGFVARGRVKRGEANNPGVALAGILTGALAVLLAIALVVVVVVYANSNDGRKLRHCIATYKDTASRQQCERDAGINVVSLG
jgi:FtsH-binding integral membrane protein